MRTNTLFFFFFPKRVLKWWHRQHRQAVLTPGWGKTASARPVFVGEPFPSQVNSQAPPWRDQRARALLPKAAFAPFPSQLSSSAFAPRSPNKPVRCSQGIIKTEIFLSWSRDFLQYYREYASTVFFARRQLQTPNVWWWLQMCFCGPQRALVEVQERALISAHSSAWFLTCSSRIHKKFRLQWETILVLLWKQHKCIVFTLKS